MKIRPVGAEFHANGHDEVCSRCSLCENTQESDIFKVLENASALVVTDF
jgi:hypothetical protein